jgi:hypothetical protein
MPRSEAETSADEMELGPTVIHGGDKKRRVRKKKVSPIPEARRPLPQRAPRHSTRRLPDIPLPRCRGGGGVLAMEEEEERRKKERIGPSCLGSLNAPP